MSQATHSGYGSLERSIMMLSAVINDVCFNRALSESELMALDHVANAKKCLETARLEEARMTNFIAQLIDG